MPAPSARRPDLYAILLLDRFTLSAFAGIVESLRLANRASGETLYDWRVLSVTGAGVTSSAGVRVACDGPLEELPRGTVLFVVGGARVQDAVSKTVLNWLRRENRRGLTIGAVCTGPHVLAEAGLLDGYRCTIHWENRDGFSEMFPDIDLAHNIYVVDRNRLTAAGGTASTDLMLNLISRDHGPDLAAEIADQIIHTSLRADSERQRLSIPSRIGVRNTRLATVVKRMEENIEEPISPATLAQDVGMSTRQLERLFRRYLNRSPKRHYMELRLRRARNLLLQTDMSVIDIALACGFTSPSHFSKCYRMLYGATPYRERGVADKPAP